MNSYSIDEQVKIYLDSNFNLKKANITKDSPIIIRLKELMETFKLNLLNNDVNVILSSTKNESNNAQLILSYKKLIDMGIKNIKNYLGFKITESISTVGIRTLDTNNLRFIPEYLKVNIYVKDELGKEKSIVHQKIYFEEVKGNSQIWIKKPYYTFKNVVLAITFCKVPELEQYLDNVKIDCEIDTWPIYYK